MNAVQTQEAGTGKWFPIIIYTPGTASQLKDAHDQASQLLALGLYASVVGFETARKEGLSDV